MVNYENTFGQLVDEDTHYEIWFLLTHTRYAVYRTIELELQQYSLTPEQAQVLSMIQYPEEEITPAILARLMFMKPHTVSSMVHRMEIKGLVKSIKDPYLNNITRIILTERGRKAYELSSRHGPVHRIMGSLNDEETNQLQQILNKILTKAGEELGWDFDSSE
jgi:DNA-binding MarR family transcriptional regulator